MSLENGYIYKIGDIQTTVYDDTVNELTQHYGGVITEEQIVYAIRQLRKMGYHKYYYVIDAFSLLLYFMEKAGVDYATAEKGEL